MYNHKLDALIAVGETGSINRASEQMYMTPNAVMKQINALESDYGIKLFDRNHRGMTLTPAGASLFRDALYLRSYSHESLERARALIQKQSHVLRIGASFTTPADFLFDLWGQLLEADQGLKFELVPFENTPENAREIMRHFGDKIDFVAGIYSDNLLTTRACDVFDLYRTPICAGVPVNHPLANHSIITLDDLLSSTVLMLDEHYMEDFEAPRAALKKAGVTVENFSFYNVAVFNRCVNENKIIIGIHEWHNIHPMIKFIPVDWNYTIPFGILHSPHPSEAVKALLEALKKIDIQHQ